MNVIVIGGGEEGSSLASLLRAANHTVKIVEIRAEEIPRLQQTVAPESVIRGNGTDPAVLEAAGIRRANVVAAVTGTDATNLVVTSLARFEFNVPHTIARVHRPTHAWMFTPAMGVDVALNQADLLAHLIAKEMLGGQPV